MRVFISGASGLVGNHCMQVFKQFEWTVLGTYFSYPVPDTVYFNTLDLHDAANCDVLAFKPDVIVHCGALTHVDYCEDHIDESYQKTVQSTLNLLALAQQCGSRFVFLSTDYVFDGQAGPYAETDEVNPLSVYAKHKLEAEEAVKAVEHSLVLRITNVYGTEYRNKNFIARILQQCLAGERVNLNLPYDQYATPINAADVALAMYSLLHDGHSGIFHLASTDFMNRVELAKRVLAYFPEAEFSLTMKSTAELNQPAPRPLRGGLLKTKFSNLYPNFQFGNVDDFIRSELRKA